MHIAFLGLGLIGGSVARAAGRSGYATRVTAWTPDGRGPGAAAVDQIVAMPTAAAAIDGADLIVLAAPPLACLALLDELAGSLRTALAADAVITDVASTKSAICARAREHELRFVGGHPVAGREAAGYAAGDADLFVDRPWVVVSAEPVDHDADERVAGLARAVGARPVLMAAPDHDSAVAAISHLPLVVSAALVEAMTHEPDWPAAAALAAGGWAGMTRLAQGDPTMGAGIVATNGPAVAARLRALQAVLGSWIAAIDGEPDLPLDVSAVERRLAEAQRRATGGGAE